MRATLLGTGTILREVLAAAELLEKEFGVPADVFSITSFSELRREALECERWNLLHPDEPPRVPYVQHAASPSATAPFVAATDYMRNVPDQIRPVGVAAVRDARHRRLRPQRLARAELRRHFEVDRHYIALAALKALADDDKIDRKTVVEAIGKLGIDPDKADPLNS